MRPLVSLPLLVFACCAALPAFAGPYSMDHVAFGGGQSTAVAGTYVLTGGVAAASSASASGGPYSLRSGFWALPAGSTTDVPDVVLPPVTGRLRSAPNPFSSRTRVSFELATASHVELGVFDLRGARVRTLVDRAMDAGRYELGWDGRDESGAALPAGIYWLRFDAGTTRRSARIVRLP
jgi:hypothetical protein